jgi:hypothetical protein
MKKSALIMVFFLIATVAFMDLGFAQTEWPPFVVPGQGQTPEQQSKDVADATAWATQQTGVDPNYVQGQLAALGPQQAMQSVTATENPLRSIGRTALRGAALGGIENNIDDDHEVGLRAAQGAVVGLGRRRDAVRQDQADQQVQSGNQARQQLEGQIATYKRAFSAYLEAKGYTVR